MTDPEKGHPLTWVCGKWGGRKLLSISNLIVLLFRLTETFWALVSDSNSVIYIGGRSGRGVPISPPDHKPFSLAAITPDHTNGQIDRNETNSNNLTFFDN